MRYFVFILFVAFFPAILPAQIVNIEERRLENKDGLKGNIDLNFSFTKNTKDVLELENLTQLSYRKGKNLYLFINEAEVIRNDNNDVLNNGFQHLRYNYRVSQLIVMEAFAQHQFNQIQRIDRRVLIGLGPRFEIIRTDSLNLNLGTQLMREYEKTSKAGYQNNYRFSTYVSVAWQINALVNFASTSYYQPKANDFSDSRISNKSTFTIGISRKLALKIIYELLHDTEVPEGVPSTIYSLETGVSYVF